MIFDPDTFNYKELEDFLRQQPCLACQENKIIEIHHVKTRGSGGGDDPWNVIPLCQKCHKEWHDNGRITFVKKYSHVLKYLQTLGWQFIDSGHYGMFPEKLIHPEYCCE